MRILFTLTLLIAAISMNARRISPEEAAKAASDYLHVSSAELISPVTADAENNAATRSAESISNAFYVFNQESDKGFVII